MAIPVKHWMRHKFDHYPLRRSPDTQGGPGRTNTLASGTPTLVRGKLDSASREDALRAGRETSVGLYTLYVLPGVTLGIDDRLVSQRNSVSYKVIHRIDPSRPDYVAWIVEDEKVSI